MEKDDDCTTIEEPPPPACLVVVTRLHRAKNNNEKTVSTEACHVIYGHAYLTHGRHVHHHASADADDCIDVAEIHRRSIFGRKAECERGFGEHEKIRYGKCNQKLDESIQSGKKNQNP